MGEHDELSLQRLTEFMRTFVPTGAMALLLERQQENRELYQDIGIGAIAPSVPLPSFQNTLRQNPLETVSIVPSESMAIDCSQDAESVVTACDNDLPSFDTF